MSAWAMPLSVLRSEVETYLLNTSTDTASLSWSVAEINDYLNEATFYTQQVTEYFEDLGSIVCTSSVGTYTAPSNVYQFNRVTWDRQFLPQSNYYELDRDDPNWRAANPNLSPYRFYFPQMTENYSIGLYVVPINSGVSYNFSTELGVVAQITLSDGVTPDTQYIFNQETGIVIGFTDTQEAMVRFQPDVVANPFTTTSGDLGEMIAYSTDEQNIGIYYQRIPDTLVADTDTPQLPADCHYGLVFYALMRCFLREGEFQDLQLAQQWFAAYGEWMDSVLQAKQRRWPERVKSLEPYEEGSLFAKRLNAIGYPMQLDLQPSYGT